MRLSLFEEDETLGAAITGAATFYGWGSASQAFSEGLLVADFKAAFQRLNRTVKSVVMRRGNGRDVTFQIVVAMRCSESLGGVEDQVRRALNGTFDSGGITITNSSASGCSSNATTPRTATPKAVTPKTTTPKTVAPNPIVAPDISGGNTSNGGGWLDSIDTTTIVLIGLLAVLVVKRL